uniref:Tripeptidyl-peptidase 2 n=1 Tax=Acrobeloides nanus TaxID=290746 RepID=A0A914CYN1_9BILA
MNGTSMSSPNAVGSIACMLSALKANNIPISPYRVRLALENTAKVPKTGSFSPFSLGNGLVQIDAALEWFKNNSDFVPTSLNRVQVTISEANQGVRDFQNRGIYLRELYQSLKPMDFVVGVEPQFKQNSDNEIKVEFERRLLLTCDASYVKLPRLFVMMNQNREFSIRIDPTGLEKGVPHFTQIVALDADNKSLGPVFRVPITVIVPLTTDETSNYNISKQLKLKPAIPYRLFVHVPEGASYVSLNMKSLDDVSVTKYVAHFMQILPNRATRNTEHYKLVVLEPNGEYKTSVKVHGGRTLELCLSKLWQSLGEADVKFDLDFHGIKPIEEKIEMFSTEACHRFDIQNSLRFEEITPSISFKHACQPVRPSESKIQPLAARDLFDNGIQTFRLLLTYSFNVHKGGEYHFALPGLTEFLYECPLDCILVQIFTAGKHYIGASSSFPDRYSIKLEKGEFKALVQLRHEKDSFLEKFKDTPLIIKHKLAAPISLDIYSTLDGAISGEGKKLTLYGLRPGQRTACYVPPVPEEKYIFVYIQL